MAQLRAGRNSEVWHVRGKEGAWILKQYHQSASDAHDRIGTEFGFLTFLQAQQIDRVPRPIGIDRRSFRAVYSFLNGEQPRSVSDAHTGQAADFILKINACGESRSADALPLAADACLSWQDHIALVDRRIDRLKAIPRNSTASAEAAVFIHNTCVPFWTRLRSEVMDALAETDPSPLSRANQILSPSDFGFHNTLDDAGTLSFVDFEYAGWDDPAKLVCDFICQPDLPPTPQQAEMFMTLTLDGLKRAEGIAERVSTLLPVHRLKWCFILLNEFHHLDRQRRLYAGVQPSGLLRNQLRKAKEYFDTHLVSCGGA